MRSLSGKALIILTSVLTFVITNNPANASKVIPLNNGKPAIALNTPGAVILHWTAPGDDGNSGRATGYDLRCTPAVNGPIDTDEEWNAADQCEGEPIPSMPGSSDSVMVIELVPGGSYYFCIKTYDDANNYSMFSNSPLMVAALGDSMILGDVNNSGIVNGIDVIYLVNYLKGGPAIPAPALRADVNGNCNVDGMDVTYLHEWLKGGPDFIRGNCGPGLSLVVPPGKKSNDETFHSVTPIVLKDGQ